MSLLNLKKFSVLAAGAGLFAIVLAQGCSNDDDQAAPSAGTGGKLSTAGSGSAPGSKAGGSNGGTGGVPDETTAGAGGDDFGADGGAGGAIDPGCIGDDGCYSCEPTKNSQFLNHCVEGGCPASFDNRTLTKLNLVGTL